MMKRMPALFVGHGSPMNAIEKNQFTAQWETLGNQIPRPEAILSISAHWFTSGSKVTDSPSPKMVYDMYGFPDALYRVVYQAPGSPAFSHQTKNLISTHVDIDNTWGIDHGTWSVLCRMYPRADIPVFQLSVDRNASFEDYFRIGRELSALREQGVLIFGSGNVVHNLARVQWEREGGYPWAEEFDSYIRQNILDGSYENVIHFEKAGSSASLAFTTADHFAPLLYVLGASDGKDRVSVFNSACVLGSLSMTGYLFD